MRPAHASVLVAYYDSLASDAHCPDLRSIYILDAPLADGALLAMTPKFAIDGSSIQRVGLFESTRATSGRAASRPQGARFAVVISMLAIQND